MATRDFKETPVPYDTLLSDSSVWIFGREMYDLVLAGSAEDRRRQYEGPTTTQANSRKYRSMPRNSRNNFLMDQLTGGDGNGDEPKLARIYSFAYQNEIYDLIKPAIFLVHGEGVDIERTQFKGSETVDLSSLAQRAAYTDRSGVSGQGQGFARGLNAWTYDRADFTVRLDLETGTFDRVLLGFELGDPHYGGHTRMAGGDAGPPPPPPPPPDHGRRTRRRRFRDD